MPQDYEKYNVSLMFGILVGIGALFILIGVILLILLKKSSKFRKLIVRDFDAYMKQLVEKRINR